MKNKKLVGSLIVMVLVVIFLSPMTNSRSLNLTNPPEISQELYDNLILVDFPIYIGDHGIYGNYSDWSYYVDNYDWCTGSGTEEDPYVIEGIHVTNENQTAHIWIEDVEHFIIRNVTVSNYAKPVGHYTFAGIFIGNGQFGLIEDCTFINCSIGISLANGRSFEKNICLSQITHTINITNCRFIGSHNASDTGLGFAIELQGTKFSHVNGSYIGVLAIENGSNIVRIRNIIVSHNDIYNYYGGIRASIAKDIYIGNNRIETTFGYLVEVGIYFYTVNNSTITNNDFYGCELGGHDYDEPKTSSDGFSIDLENCYNIEIYGNRFYDLNGNLIDGLYDLVELNYWIFVILGGVILCIGAPVGIYLIVRKKRRNREI
jgi:hypothetical protein